MLRQAAPAGILERARVRSKDECAPETPMNAAVEIFFSYAHEDEDLMNDVRRQLIVEERNGRIVKWHDRMIPAGYCAERPCARA
jgi:hypothetical protein